MSVECIKGCGRQTNEKTGVCVICKLFGEETNNGGKEMKEKDYESHKKEENGIEKRREIKPKSSGKWECSTEGCGRPGQKDRLCYRCYKAKHGVAPYPGMDKKKTKTEESGRELQVKEEAKKTRKLSKQKPDWWKKENPPNDNGSYIISVDLSFYPEIHKRLVALARAEFRTPEMQLAKVMDDEFKRMEVEVAGR